MKNRIPHNFNRITCKMLIDTNMDQAGDVLHVYKNNSGYLALNTRTGKYAYVFAAMLRNADVVHITDIS